MLFTRNGDDGKTGKFYCDQRFSKSSSIAEALGALDELNSFLGYVKSKSEPMDWSVNGRKVGTIVHWLQECLFIVQAEIAGADKSITMGIVVEMEAMIDTMEKEMPPIKSFLIPGGTEMSALFDYSRTLARKAERRVVAVSEKKDAIIGEATLAFMNRSSSLLYALARLSSHKSGINEVVPGY